MSCHLPDKLWGRSRERVTHNVIYWRFLCSVKCCEQLAPFLSQGLSGRAYQSACRRPLTPSSRCSSCECWTLSNTTATVSNLGVLHTRLLLCFYNVTMCRQFFCHRWHFQIKGQINVHICDCFYLGRWSDFFYLPAGLSVSHAHKLESHASLLHSALLQGLTNHLLLTQTGYLELV